jgi:transcriptional regulator with XRE-family HTH domain
VRALRVKAGLSQVALGKLAGYHPVYIGAMERGEVKITARALRVIRATLGLA